MFALRIDIDTIRGLRQGVPNLLGVLKRYGIKGSFFCPMGWEGDFFSVFRHRFLRSNRGFQRNARIAEEIERPATGLGDWAQLLLALFFPRRFVRHKDILHAILDQGHELGVHGYVHARWRVPTEMELRQEFLKMTQTYTKHFSIPPAGLAAPLFQQSNLLLSLCDEHDFKYASCLPGDTPFRPKINGKSCKHLQIPVTIDIDDHQELLPFFYYHAMKGTPANVSLDQFKQRCEAIRQSGHPVIMHIHPKDEGIALLEIFSQAMKIIHELNIPSMTFSQISQTYRP